MPTFEERLETRKTEYLAHESAGKDYYNTFRSKLTLWIEDNTITLDQARVIHYTLSKVGNYLNTGDWKSAYVEIQNSLQNVDCTSAIIDEMEADILAYIQANYIW